ncbi:hypothetical protein [Mesorhizobium sp. B2-4-17]|uniref:hypothetical protein n=1 Tax=Mesorhizobium sp. B2-4-17 TaxID=2589932 RepID=UPI00112D9E16|nr:hypothetical protein [Mesorhizobium sp. B2-4-17]TPK78201.1 hypothetical protein FJ548_25035 [Mesorhizobium sp. B2-4-17]
MTDETAPEGWPMDTDEEVLRTALARAIARVMRELGDAVSEAPGMTGLPQIALEEIVAGRGDMIAFFDLMKAAAALGWSIHLSIIKVDGGSLSLSIEG